jgi:hypothetical protein
MPYEPGRFSVATHLEQCLHDIRKALDEAVEKGHNENTTGAAAWTALMKKALTDLGQDPNYTYKVATSQCSEAEDTEWLYDLVWYRQELSVWLTSKNPPSKFGSLPLLTEVGLVAECEWHNDAVSIRYDFEKLLLANAPLRLMITCTNAPLMVQQYFDYFEAAILQYRQGTPGARHLIAILVNDTVEDTEQFVYRLLG